MLALPVAAAEETGAQEVVVPPRQVAAPIQGPVLPDRPVEGKGRLRIEFSGHLRWCTFPDDRVLKPPVRPTRTTQASRSEEVHTFGYQFTIAGVARAAPAVPVIFYESPVYRTASLLPAAKVGRSEARRGPRVGPSVGSVPQNANAAPGEGPDSLVPVWHDEFRCATLPDHFEFDVDPGTYDIYLAFDIMNRQGGWYHRTSSFETDVSVEAGRSTVLEGTAEFRGEERTIDLQGARLLPEEAGNGSTRP